jgi:hypothetical protein
VLAVRPNGVAQRQGDAWKTLQSLSRNFWQIAPHPFRAKPCPLELLLARFELIQRQPDFPPKSSFTHPFEIEQLLSWLYKHL